MEELVKKIKNGNKLIVDFQAEWCPGCKVMKPVFNKVSEKINNEDNGVELIMVDVDRYQDFAISFGIRNIPTIKVFNNGEVVDTKIGAIPEEKLNELVNNLING